MLTWLRRIVPRWRRGPRWAVVPQTITNFASGIVVTLYLEDGQPRLSMRRMSIGVPVYSEETWFDENGRAVTGGWWLVKAPETPLPLGGFTADDPSAWRSEDER